MNKKDYKVLINELLTTYGSKLLKKDYESNLNEKTSMTKSINGMQELNKKLRQISWELTAGDNINSGYKLFARKEINKILKNNGLKIKILENELLTLKRARSAFNSILKENYHDTDRSKMMLLVSSIEEYNGNNLLERLNTLNNINYYFNINTNNNNNYVLNIQLNNNGITIKLYNPDSNLIMFKLENNKYINKELLIIYFKTTIMFLDSRFKNNKDALNIINNLNEIIEFYN